MNDIIIRNEKQLLQFLSRDEVTLEKAIEIVYESLCIIAMGDYKSKDEFILSLEKMLKKYAGRKEKPIFLDLDIDLV